MNTVRTLFFCATLGAGLTGCNTDQDATVSTASEECSDLATRALIGQNGPEVCVTTPLSKSDTAISGTIVGTQIPGPFTVTALTSDGTTLKQVNTLANGEFTMTQLNLQNLPGKGISFSVSVNGVSSPPTKLVVGQEPPAKCTHSNSNYPFCGTHPGAIFFPIKTSITAIFLLPAGDLFGGATLLPYLSGMGTINWKPDRSIGFLTSVSPPIKPGEELTVYAENRSNESFAYPVNQTVQPNQQ